MTTSNDAKYVVGEYPITERALTALKSRYGTITLGDDVSASEGPSSVVQGYVATTYRPDGIAILNPIEVEA